LKERNSSSLDGVDCWKEKADTYWREAETLREKNSSLLEDIKKLRRGKKSASKARGEWDKVATKKVISDSGLPTLLGSATWYIIIKASLDLRVDYIFGLSLKGFWLDADISTWVQSGMIIAYATTIKWMSKYEIK
jgi:hypothetical protein